MRTTFILEVDPELVEFIHCQPEFDDPSALVNQLLRNEKKRQGSLVTGKGSEYNDEVRVAMEEFLDENIQAAD